MWEVISTLVADGTTVLLTTQYLEEADQLANQIVVVDHGRVILTGVVNSETDRALARSLATRFGVMSVTNNLKTDAEVRDSLEKAF